MASNIHLVGEMIWHTLTTMPKHKCSISILNVVFKGGNKCFLLAGTLMILRPGQD